MQLASPGCASASRQAVPLTKPVITQNGAVLNSNFSAGNQWYLDGNAIDGATGPTYIPGKSGNYQLKMTVASGCVLSADNYVYVVSPAGTGSNDIGLTVFPIPASNELNVIFSVKSATPSAISLISMSGTPVYTSTGNLTAGNFSSTINTSNIPSGTYVLRVTLGQRTYVNKVIIVN